MDATLRRWETREIGTIMAGLRRPAAGWWELEVAVEAGLVGGLGSGLSELLLRRSMLELEEVAVAAVYAPGFAREDDTAFLTTWRPSLRERTRLLGSVTCGGCLGVILGCGGVVVEDVVVDC